MMFSILKKHHKVYSKAPSQIIMTDPYYADMKQHRRDADWRKCVLYAHHKIPKKCTCGGPIRLGTDEERMSYTNAKSLR